MASKLYNQLSAKSLMNNDLVSMIKNSSNPQQLLKTLASKNPNIATLLNEISTSSSAKDLFYKKAKEMGIDPNIVLDQLR